MLSTIDHFDRKTTFFLSLTILFLTICIRFGSPHISKTRFQWVSQHFISFHAILLVKFTYFLQLFRANFLFFSSHYLDKTETFYQFLYPVQFRPNNYKFSHTTNCQTFYKSLPQHKIDKIFSTKTEKFFYLPPKCTSRVGGDVPTRDKAWMGKIGDNFICFRRCTKLAKNLDLVPAPK